MASVTTTRATIDDLYRVEGKAELVGGRIVQYMASGHLPSIAAFIIAVSLRNFAKAIGKGVAYADGIGYVVPELVSGRETFSPDASYYTGPLPKKRMRFVEGAPTFAAEVRSEGDYGRAAELEMADKRADYFAAGTLVVWDVDSEAECVHVYRADKPTEPTTYKRGDTAEAEPAVPGWRIAVDEVFSE